MTAPKICETLMLACPNCGGSGVDEIEHRQVGALILDEYYTAPITVYYACQKCGGMGLVKAEKVE
jgi:hypothetical protein